MLDRRLLVVHYSRTGATRRLAGHLARVLGADEAVIVPERDYAGASGLARAALDTLAARTPALAPLKVDPADYDLVLVGTPIWLRHISPPVRAFLEDAKSRLQDYACFYTGGEFGLAEAGENMARIVGRSPAAVLDMDRREEGRASYDDKIAAFIRELAPE